MKIPTMLSFVIAMMTCSSSLLAQDEIDKIGTVDMEKLVGDYYKADQTRKKFEKYDKEIRKENDERIEKIKALVEEAREFQRQGDNSSLEAGAKEEMFRNAGIKNQQAQAAANERVAWIKRKQAALSEKAAVEFSKLRLEIIELVQQVGREQEYDFIFDRSGSSGAQVPILSHAKDATDMTANLLLVINKDAPEESDEDGEDRDSE